MLIIVGHKMLEKEKTDYFIRIVILYLTVQRKKIRILSCKVTILSKEFHTDKKSPFLFILLSGKKTTFHILELCALCFIYKPI